MERIKVAVLNLTGGGMSGGYRKYLQCIVPRIAVHPAVSGLLVGLPYRFQPAEFADSRLAIEWLSLRPRCCLLSGITSAVRKKLEYFKPDVVFLPMARAWPSGGVPTVMMIQNMEPMVYRSRKIPLVERAKNFLRRRAAVRGIHHAERVIAISEFVQRFVVHDLGVDAERVGIVYHGVAGGADGERQTKPECIPEGWERTFCFSAGSIRPARGLEDLIHALDVGAFRESGVRLVIGGAVDKRMARYWRGLDAHIRRAGVSERVLWAGDLSASEMAWCYRNSILFVMTSRVEACPNIALEAMQSGCLCIAADNPPLPEIFMDAASFYSPGDFAKLAEGILEIMRLSEEKKGILRGSAIKRAEQFCWDTCADRTVAELLKARSGNDPG